MSPVKRTAQKISDSPVITILVIIYATVGAALVLISALVQSVDPALRLTYRGYLEAMAPVLIALGIAKAGKFIGRA